MLFEALYSLPTVITIQWLELTLMLDQVCYFRVFLTSERSILTFELNLSKHVLHEHVWLRVNRVIALLGTLVVLCLPLVKTHSTEVELASAALNRVF